MRKEVKAGKLKAAQIGGRGEYFTTDQWIDDYMESQVTPVVVPVRARRAG